MLVIAGHDPTGGAGIIADAQAISAMGAHPVTVVSALTEQDTRRVSGFEVVDAELVLRQIETLTKDINFAAVKVGMLASNSLVQAVAPVLRNLQIPIVFDPVLASGAGDSLADDGLVDVICESLLPYVEIVTPNIPELFCLTGLDNKQTSEQFDAAARCLLKTGVKHVLLTGTHAKSVDVCNRLYPLNKSYVWPRLEGEFHGSGCTLSSAISALLANGAPLETAVEEAQEFVWNSLANAYRISGGQSIPRRDQR